MFKSADEQLEYWAFNTVFPRALGVVILCLGGLFAMRWHATGAFPSGFPEGALIGMFASQLGFRRLLRKSTRLTPRGHNTGG